MSVIDTATNTVTATIPVGTAPAAVAVSPDGGTVYVANEVSNSVSVIAAATDTVTATIPVGRDPYGVAVSPDGGAVYVANFYGGSVSVIAAATDTVTATVPVGNGPEGVAVSPDDGAVYVANANSNSVSVIAAASDTVTATIPVGTAPFGVAVSPDGGTVYVANADSNSVSVIAAASNTVTATIADPGFNAPVAFGVFIQPSVPFSSLSAALVVTGGRRPGFALDARFALGVGNNGINPPAEPVTFKIGPYTATIPIGSFRALPAGRKLKVYGFIGTISKVSLAVDICRRATTPTSSAPPGRRST